MTMAAILVVYIKRLVQEVVLLLYQTIKETYTSSAKPSNKTCARSAMAFALAVRHLRER